MRSMVEGFFRSQQNPSTALRAVPLPRKAGGGIKWMRARANVNASRALHTVPDSF